MTQPTRERSSSARLRRNSTLPNNTETLENWLRVFCRVRPFFQEDLVNNTSSSVVWPSPSVDPESDTVLCSTHPKVQRTSHFLFDKILWSVPEDQLPIPSGLTRAGQAEVYAQVAAPSIDVVWSGNNATIVAYGPFASGKTYSLLGTHTDYGIVPRAIQELLYRIKVTQVRIKLLLCFMEIWNGKVRDLLIAPKEPMRARRKSVVEKTPEALPEEKGLDIYQGPNGVSVKGLTQENISSWDDAEVLIERGQHQRISTNYPSQRTHTVIQLYLCRQDSDGVMGPHMNFVEMASEDKAQTDESGKTGWGVNKSLASLGRVIDALVENQTHVPYRDAVLTHLISDSLVFNAQIVVLAALSPSPSSYESTLAALHYSSRMRRLAKLAKDKKPRVISSTNWELPPSFPRYSTQQGDLSLDRMASPRSPTSCSDAQMQTEVSNNENGSSYRNQVVLQHQHQVQTQKPYYCFIDTSTQTSVDREVEELRDIIKQLSQQLQTTTQMLASLSESNKTCSGSTQTRHRGRMVVDVGCQCSLYPQVTPQLTPRSLPIESPRPSILHSTSTDQVTSLQHSQLHYKTTSQSSPCVNTLQARPSMSPTMSLDLGRVNALLEQDARENNSTTLNSNNTTTVTPRIHSDSNPNPINNDDGNLICDYCESRPAKWWCPSCSGGLLLCDICENNLHQSIQHPCKPLCVNPPCDVCQESPSVYNCDTCGGKRLCESCDKSYHSHPRRQAHIRRKWGMQRTCAPSPINRVKVTPTTEHKNIVGAVRRYSSYQTSQPAPQLTPRRQSQHIPSSAYTLGTLK